MKWRVVIPFLIALLVGEAALVSPAANADKITAKAATHNKKRDMDREMDTDVWWANALDTYKMKSKAKAKDAGGVATDPATYPAYRRIPPTLKSTLPPAAPVPLGTDLAPASGFKNGLCESGASVPYASAHAYGRAWIDATWVDEYEFEAHAYAIGTIAYAPDKAHGRAEVADPNTMGWDDADPHTLMMNWLMQPGTEIAVEGWSPSPLYDVTARFRVESWLNYQYDANCPATFTPEERFWSVEVSWHNGEPKNEVTLGPDAGIEAYEYDEASESYMWKPISKSTLEGRLADCWSPDRNSFAATYQDVNVRFTYTRYTGEPGTLGYTFDSLSETDVTITPEPATWVLLACTGAFGAIVRRRRKN